MNQYIYSDTVFFIMGVIAFIVWLYAAYWQFILIRRINVVSSKQHHIPGNIFWSKRAQLAISADSSCQNIAKKRNKAAIAFLILVACEAVLLTVVKLI